MRVELSAKLEAQIRQDVERGAFRSVEEFVELAVTLLHSQESWIADNREAIAARIQTGWDAAERGRLAGESEVRARMQDRKRAWAKQQSA